MGFLSELFGRKPDRLVGTLDRLLDTVDHCLIIFKEGVRNYLYADSAAFRDNLSSMASLETESSALQRDIENMLYSRGSLVRYRGDIMRLLERFEHIVSIISNDLIQFEIESPNIPQELKTDFIRLSQTASLSVETTIPATKAYFTDPARVAELTSRVFIYEKEAVKQSQSIKRNVFHGMDTLKLSEKFHLRYFALHIEDLSRAAVKVAEQLSVMAIKRTL